MNVAGKFSTLKLQRLSNIISKGNKNQVVGALALAISMSDSAVGLKRKKNILKRLLLK